MFWEYLSDLMLLSHRKFISIAGLVSVQKALLGQTVLIFAPE
jgi:hypothetical protein